MPAPVRSPAASSLRVPGTNPTAAPRTRSPKSSRGRLRRPLKLPPPTLKQRVKLAKQSPYFIPLVVAVAGILGFLLFSALRIAAHASDTLVFPNLPKEVVPTAASQSLLQRVQEEMALKATEKATEEALKQTWGLNQDDLPVIQVVEEVEEVEPPVKKSRTLAELKEAMGDAWDSAELTGALNSAYRQAGKDN